MSAVLSARRLCGAVVTVPCPTLDGIGEAHAAMEALGWRWDDRLGHVCPSWPECHPVEATPERAAPRQADLFAGGAA